MTLILGPVFIIAVVLFLLAAVGNDERTKTNRSTDRLDAGYRPMADRDLNDRHWMAKRQLELTAAAQMSRIAQSPTPTVNRNDPTP